MKVKITVKQVVSPYFEGEVEILAADITMARAIFLMKYPQFDKAEFHIHTEKVGVR